MFCSKCGTEVRERAAFCHNCGALINQTGNVPKAETQSVNINSGYSSKNAYSQDANSGTNRFETNGYSQNPSSPYANGYGEQQNNESNQNYSYIGNGGYNPNLINYSYNQPSKKMNNSTIAIIAVIVIALIGGGIFLFTKYSSSSPKDIIIGTWNVKLGAEEETTDTQITFLKDGSALLLKYGDRAKATYKVYTDDKKKLELSITPEGEKGETLGMEIINNNTIELTNDEESEKITLVRKK